MSTTSYSELSPIYHHRAQPNSANSSQHVGRMRRRSTKVQYLLGTNDKRQQHHPASQRSPRRALMSPSSVDDSNMSIPIPMQNGTLPSTTNTSSSPPSISYFTWLVFLNEKWVPFDPPNQTKLEQTLTLGGTFVDVSDSHFPNVKRVRVFPKNNYLSYLGVKYRLSRIMQPDAWLDHVNLEREARDNNKTDWSNVD
ncbi:hypothetical protein BJV82DRAFT_596202 [Fennellomyces sp. T-0311]|nr:hypothetical protein BJV82DRAFT_596202 [Fennellomyces sp. T-0311]